MATTDTLDLPNGATPDLVIQAEGSDPVSLPEGMDVSGADFVRVGGNLMITTEDGDVIVVEGYFDSENPPSLVSAGGGEMDGDLVARLVGPMAPGQVADAGGGDAGSQPIGTVDNMEGTVIAVRADGTRVDLQVGDPVFQGDILETGPDGAIGVVLADETTFSMAEDGRMVLDELVYDPATQEGSINLSVVQGIFTFVSGHVAKTDPDAMTIETPVATIGIRGTQVGLEIPDGESLRVVLMEESDGFVGEVVVMNDAGTEVMNLASEFTTINAFDLSPSPSALLDDNDLISTFASALRTLPTENSNANDFGLQGDTLDGGNGDDLGDLQNVDDLADFETAAGGEDAVSEDDLGDLQTVDDLADLETAAGGEDLTDLANFETAAGGEDQPAAPEDPIDVVANSSTGGFDPLNQRDLYGSTDSAGVETPVGTEGEPLTNPNPQDTGDEGAGGTDTAPVVEGTVAFTMEEDGSLTIAEADLLANATDADGDTLSVENLTVTGGTLTDNGDGTWTFAPDTDWNGQLDLSYDVSDGTNVVSATGSITVDAVGDAVDLETSAASGAEDTAIALDIAASMPDGTGETIDSIVISGVPDGATLSSGTDALTANEDGTYTVTADQLDGLTVTPPLDSNEDFTLGVTATSTDGTVTTADVAVDVTAVGDAVDLETSAASGAEDTAIALDIAASMPDGTGETIDSIVISGVPDGATLSSGTDALTANEDGTYTVTADQLDGLTVTPPLDSNEDFTLGVTATSTDGTVTTADVAVDVTAVGDAVDLETSAASGAEDTAIALDIAASMPDGTGETIDSIVISGVPDGATLSSGTDALTANEDGTYTVTADQLDGLTVTPAAGFERRLHARRDGDLDGRHGDHGRRGGGRDGGRRRGRPGDQCGLGCRGYGDCARHRGEHARRHGRDDRQHRDLGRSGRCDPVFGHGRADGE